MMQSDECLEALAGVVGERIVVATYQAAFEWMAIHPRDLNYFSVGAMGLASSHALGLALGRPNKQVLVLDGDGSLLMNLGSLVTIASAAPPNLVHFVFQNDQYAVNGGHPTPAAGRVDFAGMADAAGYRTTHVFTKLSDLVDRIGAVLDEEGPVFVALKVVKGKDYPLDYEALFSPARRRAFKDALRRA